MDMRENTLLEGVVRKGRENWLVLYITSLPSPIPTPGANNGLSRSRARPHVPPACSKTQAIKAGKGDGGAGATARHTFAG